MTIHCLGKCDSEWLVHDDPACQLYEGTPHTAADLKALYVLRDLVRDSGIVHEAEPPGIDYMTVQINPATWAEAIRLVAEGEDQP